MKNITCFFCHKLGHIVAHCKTRHINLNQQKMQQMRRTPQARKWKDNLSPGTQIISMATVMHAIILDINLLIVNCVKKWEQNIILQLKCTLVK